MTLAVPDGAVTIDPHLGHLRGLRFWDGRKWLDPLHCAGREGRCEAAIRPGRPASAARASAALWQDDSPWEVREVVQSGRAALARLSLGGTMQGASVEKEISLRRGEPILYQSHLLSGGRGTLSLAHHPVVHMAAGGRLSYSPKRRAPGGDAAPDAGFAGPVDLPDGPGLRRPLTLVEAAGNPLGWTAVLRHAEEDIVFVLRDPEMLPVTTLWTAERGRVLGIGDGCASGDGTGTGCAAPGGDCADGRCPLALAPRRVHRLRHAIGVVPRPKGWSHVTAVSIDQNTLRLEGDGEGAVWLPFDGRFFGGTRQ